MTPRKISSCSTTSCRSIHLLVILSMIAVLIACGGSSHSSNTTTPPPTPSVSLSTVPTPTPSSLVEGGTLTITPTILNDSGNVNWSCTPGNSASTCGSFSAPSSANGVSVIYTAPSTTASVVITATLSDNSGISSSLSTINITATPAISVTLTTPPPTSLAPSGTANMTATVNNDSMGGGVNWSCSPTPTCGASNFSVASTASGSPVTFTAPSTTGNVVITATAVDSSSATATATVTVTTAASGTLNTGAIYVFSASGVDNNGSYSVAGAFTVGANGTITGGEQDFIDVDPTTTNSARAIHDSISSIGSGYATNPSDSNLLITLNTGDNSIGVNGVETLAATLVSSSEALIVEFDNSATSRGSLDQQTGSPVAPSGGYAFYLSGEDPAAGVTTVLGGVLNFGSGNLSTTTSAFDINDAGLSQPYTDQLFSSGTISTSLDQYGQVQISLIPAPGDTSGTPQINLVGYVVGPEHIRLVETADSYGGVTGGGALGQSGTFTNSALSGSSYVFSTAGIDTNFALQVAGVLTLSATSGSSTAGTVSGTLNYNDTTVQNGPGGTAFTGTYTLDTTNPGRITLSNLTDTAGDFNLNLQLYLSGTGNAAEISVDTGDVLAGLGFQQTGAGSFTAASFSGSYALELGQVTASSGENDGVGPVAVDSGTATLAGFVDFNNAIPPTPDVTVTGTFAANANGIFTGTITGIDSVSASTADNFTYYLVDNIRAVAIETDSDQLTLGYFQLQQ
jgi:hypothetical protein